MNAFYARGKLSSVNCCSSYTTYLSPSPRRTFLTLYISRCISLALPFTIARCWKLELCLLPYDFQFVASILRRRLAKLSLLDQSKMLWMQSLLKALYAARVRVPVVCWWWWKKTVCWACYVYDTETDSFMDGFGHLTRCILRAEQDIPALRYLCTG